MAKHLNVSVEYFTPHTLYVIYKADSAQTETSEQRMTSKDHGQWRATLPLDGNADADLVFRFEVRNAADERVDEETARFVHRHPSATAFANAAMQCLWNTADQRTTRYSALYDIMHPANTAVNESLTTDEGLAVRVDNFVAQHGKTLCLVGSTPTLGSWDTSKALRPTVTDRGRTCTFRLSRHDAGAEYKFIYIDTPSGHVEWEDGNNRQLPIPDNGLSLTVEARPRLSETAERLAGMVIPVFSLRSEKSWGVGDFGDLARMADWAAACGMHVLQILPVNDTTRAHDWTDSYPYNAISAFALHPMYADLNDLANSMADKAKQRDYTRRAAELNRMPQLDYEQVEKLKTAFLLDYWAEHRTTLAADAEFTAFESENAEWLRPYSAFRVLMQHFSTANYRDWPVCTQYDTQQVDDYITELGKDDERKFHMWVQFLLDGQLRRAHDHANAVGVALKGDIPIGISRDSATTWLSPRYFNFNGQAGAPPDYFSEHGQNWGFPTYNWDEILREGGQWWTRRLERMARYFDAYRIDHVLGFFRIWEIPYTQTSGMLGHFNPALPMTADEIRSYGFAADIEENTLPLFDDADLQTYFGTRAGHIAMRYLQPVATTQGQRYTLRPQYRSQRQIESETLPGEDRKRLLQMAADLQFIKDDNRPNAYHPCIASQRARAYRRLSENDRTAYNRIAEHYFYHRHDDYWTTGALAKLHTMRNATNMLVCAEDLGMIPDCMRTVLARLGILSLEVESMPKYAWGRFADLSQNPTLSVDTITTHDMEPLRLWWQTHRDDAQTYWNDVLCRDGQAPAELSGEHCRDIVLRHLQSPSALCLLAWQDWMAISESRRATDTASEQINKPAVARHYWRYRMHTTIERLAADESLTQSINTLIALSNRKA